MPHVQTWCPATWAPPAASSPTPGSTWSPPAPGPPAGGGAAPSTRGPTGVTGRRPEGGSSTRSGSIYRASPSSTWSPAVRLRCRLCCCLALVDITCNDVLRLDDVFAVVFLVVGYIYICIYIHQRLLAIFLSISVLLNRI